MRVHILMDLCQVQLVFWGDGQWAKQMLFISDMSRVGTCLLEGLPLSGLDQFSAPPAVFIKFESTEVGITTQWISATKAATSLIMIGTPVIGNIAEI